jgi:ABC-type transport system substrate-binding protein
MSAGGQRNVDNSFRSQLVRTLMLGVAACLFLSACGPTPTGPAAPTTAPAAAKTAPTAANTAPAAPNTAVPQKQSDQVIRESLQDEPPFLDPAMATDGSSLTPIRQIFVGLARFDKDLKVVPWAADSWDVSPDGQTYTFHIHKGIKWHDGSGELKADDFKYSIERTIKKKDSTVSMLYLGDIVGAQDLLDGKKDTLESVRVVDPYTLAITIDAPKAFFLGKLVYPTSYAVKKDTVEKGGEGWATKPETLVGAGPFKVTEWTHDQRVVVSRFDDYWEGKASLARVEMPIVKDENTRQSMYEKGDLDIALVPSGQLDRVKGDPKLSKELSSYARLRIYYLAMNQAKPPFDKKEVREAFNYGVNKAQLTEIALKGALTPADGIVPPGMPGNNKDLKPLAYDATKAKQLLAQAGYPDGRGLPAFNIVTRQGAGTYKKIAETLTGVYKQSLGIDLTVEEMEWGAFLAQVQRGNAPPAYVLAWGADYPDPQNFLDILFHTGSKNNRTNYHNEQVDKLLDQAAVEPDFDKRMKIYNQAEQMIVDDTPWAPLAFGQEYILQRPYVQNAVQTPMGLLYYYPIQITAH